MISLQYEFFYYFLIAVEPQLQYNQTVLSNNRTICQVTGPLLVFDEWLSP